MYTIVVDVSYITMVIRQEYRLTMSRKCISLSKAIVGVTDFHLGRTRKQEVFWKFGDYHH